MLGEGRVQRITVRPHGEVGECGPFPRLYPNELRAGAARKQTGRRKDEREDKA